MKHERILKSEKAKQGKGIISNGRPPRVVDPIGKKEVGYKSQQGLKAGKDAKEGRGRQRKKRNKEMHGLRTTVK